MERLGGHPDGRVDVVDPAVRLHQSGHLHRLVEADSTVEQILPREPHPECAVRTDRGTHCLDDLEEEPGTVLQRPSITVRALVRGGGEETAHQRRVGALQFDPVVSASDTVLGHARVPVDEGPDLPLIDRLGNFTEQ